jgi:hypothetical protein
VKFRPFPVLAGLLLVALVPLGVREASWRAEYPAAGVVAASPDGAVVAEARKLPDRLHLGTGVFLRRHWNVLASLHPRLVFAGDCNELDLRWFGERRLVIRCDVRSGEPALLQDLVDDVRIELVVDRHFG